MSELQLLIADLLLFTGLGCLALGHVMASRERRFRLPGQPQRHALLPRRTGHLVSAFGYLTFGVFWVLQVGHYLEIKDPVNALFSFLALPFFAYLAYHEYLSYEWNEIYGPLRWLGATAVLAGVIYFSVDRVPYLTGALVKLVADQSAWTITHLFGYHVDAGAIDYGTGRLWFRAGSGHEMVRVPFNAVDPMAADAPHINIVLACTALQSMIVFIGGILSTRADNDRRWKAFMVTVPVIYVLNLLRNAIVAFLVYDGHASFEVAHSYVGKGGSLVALVFLAVATFTLLPEMHENILGLFDLPKRRRGGVPLAAAPGALPPPEARAQTGKGMGPEKETEEGMGCSEARARQALGHPGDDSRDPTTTPAEGSTATLARDPDTTAAEGSVGKVADRAEQEEEAEEEREGEEAEVHGPRPGQEEQTRPMDDGERPPGDDTIPDLPPKDEQGRPVGPQER